MVYNPYSSIRIWIHAEGPGTQQKCMRSSSNVERFMCESNLIIWQNGAAWLVLWAVAILLSEPAFRPIVLYFVCVSLGLASCSYKHTNTKTNSTSILLSVSHARSITSTYHRRSSKYFLFLMHLIHEKSDVWNGPF
jgi:hypothetical protein